MSPGLALLPTPSLSLVLPPLLIHPSFLYFNNGNANIYLISNHFTFKLPRIHSLS